MIDRQGKLFGVINILDLFLILLLIGAGIFAAGKFLGSNDEGGILAPAEKYPVTYKLYNSAEHKFVIDRIKPGTVIRNANNNQVIGQVVDIEKYPGKTYLATADGQMVLSEVPNKYESIITIRTTEATGSTPSVGGVALLVGNRLRIKGPDFTLEVLISDIVPEAES
jgi:hypothetical protein